MLGPGTKASHVLADPELGTSSHKILCMKQLLRWFVALRGDVPKTLSDITDLLDDDTSALSLGVKYDTRNGWKELSRFAKKFFIGSQITERVAMWRISGGFGLLSLIKPTSGD